MSTLEEVPYFTPQIYEIGRGEEATGGKLGNANIAPQQLACRTQWLKERLEELAAEIEAGGGGSGGGDGAVRELTADFDVQAFRVVTTDETGKAVYADAGNLAHLGRPLGIALTSGTTFFVKEIGLVENSAWSWTPGKLLFLGTGGFLTHSGNVGNFAQQIGFAETATSVAIKLGTPVKRAN